MYFLIYIAAINYKYSEKIEIPVSTSHLVKSKKYREYFYIYKNKVLIYKIKLMFLKINIMGKNKGYDLENHTLLLFC